MDGQKPKPKCEIVVNSEPKDINNTGYNEEPAKYMAAPKKWFNDALQKAIDKWRYR